MDDDLEEEDKSEDKPEFCQLKPEIGPCKGQWKRYFYNGSIDDCSLFDYGGCDGNENNFHNLLACRVVCQLPNKTQDDLILQIILGSAKNRTIKVSLWSKYKLLEWIGPVCSRSQVVDSGKKIYQINLSDAKMCG